MQLVALATNRIVFRRFQTTGDGVTLSPAEQRFTSELLRQFLLSFLASLRRFGDKSLRCLGDLSPRRFGYKFHLPFVSKRVIGKSDSWAMLRISCDEKTVARGGTK